MNIEDLKKELPDLDLEIVKEIIYWDGWSSYEEFGTLLIFKAFDDSYQKTDYGYNVFASQRFFNDFQEITKEEADALIAEMNEVIEYSAEMCRHF